MGCFLGLPLFFFTGSTSPVAARPCPPAVTAVTAGTAVTPDLMDISGIPGIAGDGASFVSRATSYACFPDASAANSSASISRIKS
jgi:hypothetical protein